MVPEGSSKGSQEPATDPYPEASKSSSHFSTSLLQDTL
jgi:hypothetical protein